MTTTTAELLKKFSSADPVAMCAWIDEMEENAPHDDKTRVEIEAKRQRAMASIQTGLPMEIIISLPGDKEMEFCLIPPGEFWMGSRDDDKHAMDDEKPRHRRKIKTPFYMAKYPCTQEQYEAVMGTNPSNFMGEVDSPKRPVEQVNWFDSRGFCRKLTGLVSEHLAELGMKEIRLPREHEWEYACRAGTSTYYPWGDSCNGTDANVNGQHPFGTDEKGTYLGHTCPVGRYEANHWGLYDVIGNVWEWCQDEYDQNAYEKAARAAEGEEQSESRPLDVSCVAAPGASSRGTVARRTATASRRITASTTSGSVSASEGEHSRPLDESSVAALGAAATRESVEGLSATTSRRSSDTATLGSVSASEGEHSRPFDACVAAPGSTRVSVAPITATGEVPTPDPTVSDPSSPDNPIRRCLRSGSWNDYAIDCRSAYRNWYDAVISDGSGGFRPIISMLEGYY